ncbi:hypothetical protein J6590_035552 [Homalodisca vitripennis]|nr:hypothetical protein J6590_035552 [Homalodisca vitripennis]
MKFGKVSLTLVEWFKMNNQPGSGSIEHSKGTTVRNRHLMMPINQKDLTMRDVTNEVLYRYKCEGHGRLRGSVRCRRYRRQSLTYIKSSLCTPRYHLTAQVMQEEGLRICGATVPRTENRTSEVDTICGHKNGDAHEMKCPPALSVKVSRRVARGRTKIPTNQSYLDRYYLRQSADALWTAVQLAISSTISHYQPGRHGRGPSLRKARRSRPEFPFSNLRGIAGVIFYNLRESKCRAVICTFDLIHYLGPLADSVVFSQARK